MLAEGFALRRATVADALPLSAFAERTFAETFGPDTGPDDLARYLGASYGEAQQRSELADPNIITILIERDTTIVAYAMVRRGSSTPECVTAPSPVELWRFYLDRAWHGRGVAQELMSASLAAARDLGGQSMWLSVWEHNPRAIAFYSKMGFVDSGSKDFTVGSDRQTDRVYVAKL